MLNLETFSMGDGAIIEVFFPDMGPEISGTSQIPVQRGDCCQIRSCLWNLRFLFLSTVSGSRGNDIASSPGTSEGCSRDEKRGHSIPMRVDDIINLPIDEFRERLRKYDWTDPQLSLHPPPTAVDWRKHLASSRTNGRHWRKYGQLKKQIAARFRIPFACKPLNLFISLTFSSTLIRVCIGFHQKAAGTYLRHCARPTHIISQHKSYPDVFCNTWNNRNNYESPCCGNKNQPGMDPKPLWNPR